MWGFLVVGSLLSPVWGWQPGFCRETQPQSGDCSAHAHGSWRLPQIGMDQQAAREFCEHRCRSCSNCRYISWSASYADCSWFAECDLSALKTQPPSFRTVFLNASCTGHKCLRKLHLSRQQEHARYKSLRLQLVGAMKKRHTAELAAERSAEAVRAIQREMQVSRQAQVDMGLKVQAPVFVEAADPSAARLSSHAAHPLSPPAESLALRQRLLLPSYYERDPFVVGPTQLDDLAMLHAAVRELRPATILEIGFLSGDGTRTLISAADPDAAIFSIDINPQVEQVAALTEDLAASRASDPSRPAHGHTERVVASPHTHVTYNTASPSPRLASKNMPSHTCT